MKATYFPTLRFFLLFAALSLFAVGCGSSGSTGGGTGSVTAKLVWNATGSLAKSLAKAPTGITTIRVEVTAADMTKISKDFSGSDAGGTVDGIPAGSNRTITVYGIQSVDLVRYQAQKTGITIVAGQNTDVGAIIMELISGLKVADYVGVVDATTPGNSLAKLLSKFMGLAVPTSATADYNKDITNVYVNEKAGDAFKTVNMILCMISQTKYSDMVNQGFYTAMINTNSCKGNDSASLSGSSASAGTSATSAPSYDVWTVKSERATATSEQIFTAYIHLAQAGKDNGPMTVEAKATITEGVSATNPLGIFTMYFKGYAPSDSTKKIVMKGILKTELNAGKVMIKFAELDGDASAPLSNTMAAYLKDDTAKTGSGSAYVLDSYNGTPKTGRINFAYNSTLFKRNAVQANYSTVINAESACLDRTKFETSAWRYGVYSSSGSRKNLNGGFPINTKQDGTGISGYLSYYGLNLNSPTGTQTLADGAKVYKKSWSSGVESNTEYSIYIRGGKLKKHVKSSITLNDIKNIPLEGSLPGSTTMNRITWDGSTLAIRATAAMSTSGTPVWTELSPAVAITNTTTLPYTNIGLYSQSLGGQLNIQMANCIYSAANGGGFKCDTPSATTNVIFYKESTVYPDDTVPSALACYDNCPKAGSSSGMASTDMTYQMFMDPNVDNRHNYSFTYMLLKDNAYNVILTTAPTGQSWGFSSGPLFDPSSANMSLLKCDWDSSKTCGWKAWNSLSEFYTWETGPNSWNQFNAAKDSAGAFVKFDQPLQAMYVHSQTDSTAYDYKYNGTKFFLQFNGFGDLQGIPGKCVNPNDPSAVVLDCSGGNYRWVPEFTIPAGSEVTMNSNKYLVKPLDVEQRMKSLKTNGACTAVGKPPNMSASFPVIITDWVDPALPTEPVITEAPKVIAGTVQ